MSIKILTKSGEEITAIDDARAYNFDAGNKSGIVKGALNEGKLFLVSSNVIGLDSCELRISGHRIVIDSAESITMANRPSVATRYSMIAEVVVSDASVPSFRLFIQPAKTELIQQNLYKTLNGNGTYQLRIGNFTLGSDGLISDIVRTADVISGATGSAGDIEFNVTTETIAGDLDPEVNVDFNEETKKYDMHFALPLSSGTSVVENGEVVKRFNADLKVDKEEGKGLSTNDFTNEEKNKLAGLSNYDDSELKNTKANTDASNLTNENVESWKEKLGYENVKTVYDMFSIDSAINLNRTTGVFGEETVSKDYSKAKKVRVYAVYGNYVTTVFEISLDYLLPEGLYKTIDIKGTEDFKGFYLCSISINSTKDTLTVEKFGFVTGTTFTDRTSYQNSYKVFKIEEVY